MEYFQNILILFFGDSNNPKKRTNLTVVEQFFLVFDLKRISYTLRFMPLVSMGNRRDAMTQITINAE